MEAKVMEAEMAREAFAATNAKDMGTMQMIVNNEEIKRLVEEGVVVRVEEEPRCVSPLHVVEQEKTSKQQKTAKQAVPPLPKKNTKTSSTSSASHQTPPSVAEKPPSSLPSHPPPHSMKKKPARTPAKQKLKAN
ncbi:hypothetical protein L5515_019411 [Caenorhabditis briggsae]|uniref:Uncharacterized protein n=1 Tax=Caenorhabditis briggsae TaxID=6238 RepID=A0AAE9FE75_CAEBR|nr:hypothetical protein L5515_019411 [Caenorhabditis briggsae]